MVDVGTIGERQFSLWCEQADLTANPANQDRYGWDFVVQFPHLDTTAPLDTRPAQLKCMVQVKSTAIGSRRAAIKLDNWERMVNDPLPWFVCAMVLDGATVSEVYLVHIDQQHTHRILHRLRSLRATEVGAAHRLHEFTLDVTWGDKDMLARASGVELRDIMLRHMGTDPYQYGQHKREWYENAGYEDHPKHITANIVGKSPDEIWRKITDFSLGLNKKLPIHLKKIIDQRFGIPVTEVDLTSASNEEQLGYLKDSPPTIDESVTVAISNTQQTSTTAFRCEVFHSANFYSKVPKKYRKWRFASSSFELLMDEPPRKKPRRFPLSFKFQFQFPPLSNPEVVAPLADLAKIGRVLRHLVDATEKGLRVELRNATASWTLPGEMGKIKLPDEYVAIAEIFEKTMAVVSAFDLDMDMLIAPRSIAEQQERIRLLWTALCWPQGCFPTRVPLSLDRAELNGRKVAIVLAVSLIFGECRIVGAFAICGVARIVPPAENEATELQVPEGEVRLLWKEVVRAAGWSPKELAERLQENARRMRSDEFAWTTAPSPTALAWFVGVEDAT